MKQLENLKALSAQIMRWGQEKALKDEQRQYLKLCEEVGELAQAILKDDKAAIADAIGDCFVVIIQIMRIRYNERKDAVLDKVETGFLIVGNPNHPPQNIDDLVIDVCASVTPYHRIWALRKIAERYELDLVKCVADVYDIISKRTGATVNGVFVKD